MTAGEIWIIAGLLGCAAEMAAPGVFLLPIGLAAVGTGAATWAGGLGWGGQVPVFLALTAALIALAALRMRRPARPVLVNAPAGELVGLLCHALAFEGGEGRVTLRDGTWPARTTDRSAPLPGTPLRVTGLDGTTLLVAQAAALPEGPG